MPSYTPIRRLVGLGLIPVLGLLGLFFLNGCQDPAGTPPTFEPGTVSFSFTGQGDGSFTAEGPCYRSTGYPSADTACAVAFPVDDTVRIRAVLDPREFAWRHVNIDVPSDGECDPPGACRIAFDFLTTAGKVERSYKSTDADVVITERLADRLRGTFSGRLEVPGGTVEDTLRVHDGVFDVPIAP